MNAIKINKEKRGVFLTIAGRRIKIPYRDIKLFRETVEWTLNCAASPKVNFKDFSIKMERHGYFKTKITLYTDRKEYSGEILDIELSSI